MLSVALMGGGGAAPVAYLLRDEFTTAQAAPLTSPRTCEPGPGTLTVAGANWSISSARLQIPAGVVANSHRVYGTGIARATGLTFLALNAQRAATTSFHPSLGFSTNVATLNASSDWDSGFVFAAFGTLKVQFCGSALELATYAATTDYHLAVVLRTTGAYWLWYAAGAWRLLWVGDTCNTATVYPTLYARDTAGSLDGLRVAQLPAPWTDDYGIATQRLAGARSDGDTFTHEADCILEYTTTTLAGGILFRFRKQDDDNFWYIRIDGANTVKLTERVSGVDTTRISSGTPAAPGQRLVIVADDETIKLYQANALCGTYSSASNFKTETSGDLVLPAGGEVSNIVAWPRTLSGSALSTLQRYTS